MKKPTPRNFDFYGLKIDSVRSVQKPVPHYQITASDASEAPSCLKCGHSELNFQGRKTLKLRDAPINGRRVIVEVSLRSRQCRACKAQFVAPKRYQDGLHHFTPRLRQWVMERAGEKKLALAAQTGIGETSVKHILNSKPISGDAGLTKPTTTPMNESEIVKLMESSKSEAEWNANADKVKKACGGYPDFWYSAIVMSGVAARTAAAFGGTAEMRIGVSSRGLI